MRPKRIARDIDARFHRRDPIIHDHPDRDFPQAHPNHFAEADRRVGDSGSDPKPKEIEKNDAQNEPEKRNHSDADEIKGIHARSVAASI